MFRQRLGPVLLFPTVRTHLRIRARDPRLVWIGVFSHARKNESNDREAAKTIVFFLY